MRIWSIYPIKKVVYILYKKSLFELVWKKLVSFIWFRVILHTQWKSNFRYKRSLFRTVVHIWQQHMTINGKRKLKCVPANQSNFIVAQCLLAMFWGFSLHYSVWHRAVMTYFQYGGMPESRAVSGCEWRRVDGHWVLISDDDEVAHSTFALSEEPSEEVKAWKTRLNARKARGNGHGSVANT